jgi:hypothetical protein
VFILLKHRRSLILAGPFWNWAGQMMPEGANSVAKTLREKTLPFLQRVTREACSLQTFPFLVRNKTQIAGVYLRAAIWTCTAIGSVPLVKKISRSRSNREGLCFGQALFLCRQTTLGMRAVFGSSTLLLVAIRISTVYGAISYLGEVSSPLND